MTAFAGRLIAYYAAWKTWERIRDRRYIKRRLKHYKKKGLHAQWVPYADQTPPIYVGRSPYGLW